MSRSTWGLSVFSLVGGLSGCSPPNASIVKFGGATSGFATQMAETAAGTYLVCVDAHSVKLDVDFVTGVARTTPENVLSDPCERYARTGQLYAQLARQLGAFGQAMATLAENGDTDYTDQLGELTIESVKLVPSLQGKQTEIDKASMLSGKLLGWFAQGYSSTKIASALKESEAELIATLDLLSHLLDALDEQASLYASNINKLVTAPDYELKKRGAYQAALVRKHLPRLQRRRLVLASTRESLNAVREVHIKLVQEAQRPRQGFDVESLVDSAKKLQAKVLEHQALVDQLRRTL